MSSDRSDKPELAVFGGSFDPPHMGHVFLATYALSVAGVEQVLVVPTFQHAFGKPLLSFEQRLAMCQLAFAPLRGVEVCAIERELGGISRTLRLVTELRARYPDHQLRLLIGSDILSETRRWLGFEEIAQIAPLLVAQRAGHVTAEVDGPLLPEISSSVIRSTLGHVQDVSHVSHWLPRTVREYIREHGLYQQAAP